MNWLQWSLRVLKNGQVECSCYYKHIIHFDPYMAWDARLGAVPVTHVLTRGCQSEMHEVVNAKINAASLSMRAKDATGAVLCCHVGWHHTNVLHDVHVEEELITVLDCQRSCWKLKSCWFWIACRLSHRGTW